MGCYVFPGVYGPMIVCQTASSLWGLALFTFAAATCVVYARSEKAR